MMDRAGVWGFWEVPIHSAPTHTHTQTVLFLEFWIPLPLPYFCIVSPAPPIPPPPLTLQCLPGGALAVDFHPSQPFVAVGCRAGVARFEGFYFFPSLNYFYYHVIYFLWLLLLLLLFFFFSFFITHTHSFLTPFPHQSNFYFHLHVAAEATALGFVCFVATFIASFGFFFYFINFPDLLLHNRFRLINTASAELPISLVCRRSKCTDVRFTDNGKMLFVSEAWWGAEISYLGYFCRLLWVFCGCFSLSTFHPPDLNKLFACGRGVIQVIVNGGLVILFITCWWNSTYRSICTYYTCILWYYMICPPPLLPQYFSSLLHTKTKTYITWKYFSLTGVLGCGAAEATGLGYFFCFFVTLVCCQPTKLIWAGLFH